MQRDIDSEISKGEFVDFLNSETTAIQKWIEGRRHILEAAIKSGKLLSKSVRMLTLMSIF